MLFLHSYGFILGVLDFDDQIQTNATAAPSVVIAPAGTSLKDILTSPTWSNFVIPTAIGLVVYVVYKVVVKALV